MEEINNSIDNFVKEVGEKDQLSVSIEQATGWQRVLNAARQTVGKAPLQKEPSDGFKRSILLAEHSPIRLLEYDITFKRMRQWVTVHLVRHHNGVVPFVATQRADRSILKYDRDALPQGSLNDMMMSCNAQSIINISRKRLCAKASKETRYAWTLAMHELRKIDPILEEKCVRECTYRGFCPEMESCGYDKTEKFQEELIKYRKK